MNGETLGGTPAGGNMIPCGNCEACFEDLEDYFSHQLNYHCGDDSWLDN